MFKCRVLELSFEAKMVVMVFTIPTHMYGWRVEFQYIYMEISNLTLNVALCCIWNLALIWQFLFDIEVYTTKEKDVLNFYVSACLHML